MNEPKIGVVMFDAATDAPSVVRAVELAGGQPVRCIQKRNCTRSGRLKVFCRGFSSGTTAPGALAATQPIMRVLKMRWRPRAHGHRAGQWVPGAHRGRIVRGFIANATPATPRRSRLCGRNNVSA